MKILVITEGIPAGWYQRVPEILPLGGEGRFAGVDIQDYAADILPEMPLLVRDEGMVNFTVSLVTPGCFGFGQVPDSDPHYPDRVASEIDYIIRNSYREVPGNCLSACVGKLSQLGGWDIMNQEPRPLLPVIPAGSAWFFQADVKDTDRISALHGQCLGDNNGYGFNQIIIGTWGVNR